MFPSLSLSLPLSLKKSIITYFFKKEEARETNPHLGHSAETAGQQKRQCKSSEEE